VERILSECKELPQILLMENVPDVIGSKFIKDFQRWESRLRELGYSNHTEILNSKDFGIPQNRERAFMVSILGSSLYNFPQKQPLKLRLKDMLEKEVDEKYYLSDTTIERISQWKAQQDPLDTMEKTDKLGISPTLTARGAGEDHSGMILVKELATLDETKEFANYLTWKDSKGRLNTQDHRAYFEDRLSGTIPAMERGVPNVLLNGEPKVDVIANIRHNGTSQSGNVYDKEQLSPTLCATDYKNPPKITEPKVNVVGNYSPSNHNASSIVDSNGIAPTVMENHGTITGVVVNEPSVITKNIIQKVWVRKHEVDIQALKDLLRSHKNKPNQELSNLLNLPLTQVEHWFRQDASFSIPPKEVWFKLKELLNIIETKFDNQVVEFVEKDGEYDMSNRVYDDLGISPTLTTSDEKKVINNLRIRKLTPRECYRLMGFGDQAFDLAQPNQSNSSLYHQAGDSIVVNVLMELFRSLL
jgi:site-specific DNA-cytosine methylase